MENIQVAGDTYAKMVDDLAALAAINYGLIRGVQEGFILDSLEALDYLIDCKGESTAIEKAVARLSGRSADAPGGRQAGSAEGTEEDSA
jgi:hypothetical protein